MESKKDFFEFDGMRIETRKLVEASKQFTAIINTLSLDNDLDIPDFILAQFLIDALINLGTTKARSNSFFEAKNNIENEIVQKKIH